VRQLATFYGVDIRRLEAMGAEPIARVTPAAWSEHPDEPPRIEIIKR
jgi:hypothetical protein